jgi:hypothetical protein
LLLLLQIFDQDQKLGADRTEEIHEVLNKSPEHFCYLQQQEPHYIIPFYVFSHASAKSNLVNKVFLDIKHSLTMLKMLSSQEYAIKVFHFAFLVYFLCRFTFCNMMNREISIHMSQPLSFYLTILYRMSISSYLIYSHRSNFYSFKDTTNNECTRMCDSCITLNLVRN